MESVVVSVGVWMMMMMDGRRNVDGLATLRERRAGRGGQNECIAGKREKKSVVAKEAMNERLCNGWGLIGGWRGFFLLA